MSYYYGVGAGSAAAAVSGGLAATLADLQIQINAKLNKTGGVLINATLEATPAFDDNSLNIASTAYVDRGLRVRAPGYVLMELNII